MTEENLLCLVIGFLIGVAGFSAYYAGIKSVKPAPEPEVKPHKLKPRLEIHCFVMGDGSMHYRVYDTMYSWGDERTFPKLIGMGNKTMFETIEEAEQCKQQYIKQLNANTVVSDYIIR